MGQLIVLGYPDAAEAEEVRREERGRGRWLLG